MDDLSSEKEGIDIGSDALGRLMRKGSMKQESWSLFSWMEFSPWRYGVRK